MLAWTACENPGHAVIPSAARDLAFPASGSLATLGMAPANAWGFTAPKAPPDSNAAMRAIKLSVALASLQDPALTNSFR
jgi:hypothetical protein